MPKKDILAIAGGVVVILYCSWLSYSLFKEGADWCKTHGYFGYSAEPFLGDFCIDKDFNYVKREK